MSAFVGINGVISVGIGFQLVILSAACIAGVSRLLTVCTALAIVQIIRLIVQAIEDTAVIFICSRFFCFIRYLYFFYTVVIIEYQLQIKFFDFHGASAASHGRIHHGASQVFTVQFDFCRHFCIFIYVYL